MKRSENQQHNIREYRAGSLELESLPRVVYIEATNACNLRCPMCPITIGVAAYLYPVKYFDWGHFDLVRPYLETAERCMMSGGGEPLLHPRFLDMVAEVKKAGAQTIFNTNGTLLTETIAKELVRLEADTISFSVDGATPETYARIRVGADFDAVERNIARLVKIKRAAGAERPFLNLQMTLLDENRREIAAMVELAARWGIRHLVIEPLTPVFSEDDTYKNYYEKSHVKPEEVADDIRAARDKAKLLGLIFSSHYLVLLGDEPGYGDPRSFRCVEPWINIGFRADGTIFPCCGTSHTVGRLESSASRSAKGGRPFQAWNNDEFRQLRDAFARYDPPDYCNQCISEGRAMHFNEDLVGRGIYQGEKFP